MTEGKTGASEFDNATCKGRVKRNEEHESVVKTDSIKTADIEVVKPFFYSQEGLLRLIRLDLGILDDKEHVKNSRTVEAIDNNIKSEELFDPPSKKLHRNFSPDSDSARHADTDKVLASHKDEVDHTEEWNMSNNLSMIQADTKPRMLKRKKKEMGIGSYGSEYGKTIETKCGQEEERKKVMGMSDIHLVSVDVYYPD